MIDIIITSLEELKATEKKETAGFLALRIKTISEDVDFRKEPFNKLDKAEFYKAVSDYGRNPSSNRTNLGELIRHLKNVKESS